MNLLVRRILAFIVDYLLIASYIVLLLGITLAIRDNLGISSEQQSPIIGQLIAFISLTFPVFLYSFLTERSKHAATLGKRLLKIEVVSPSSKAIFIRNFLKYLPWEIAHTGVHWLVFYENSQLPSPLWVWVLIVIPEVIVFVYMLSIYAKKGKSGLYDRLAKTSIQLKST